MEGNACVYQVNPVSRTTGEGRAEFWSTWGPGYYQYGAGLVWGVVRWGGNGEDGAGQLNLYVGTISPSQGDKSDGFVETHLRRLCVILRSRALRVVCPHQGYRPATPLATTV